MRTSAPCSQPGTSGRFYLYTAIDHRGIHGVRDDEGRSAFAFPRSTKRRCW